MIALQEAMEIAAREMARDQDELGVKEFDIGYLVWVTPPPREDQAGPPATVGGAYLIVDKEDGETSTWPMLGPTVTIQQYQRTKRGDQATWVDESRD